MNQNNPRPSPHSRISFSAVLLALALGAAPSAQASLLNGLQGYWTFDGNAEDLSGNGRDLTLSTGTSFAPGLIGSALDLPGDGSKNAGRNVDDSVFDFGAGEFTIQLWVDFDSASGPQVLIEKFSNPTGPGWTLYRAGNALEFYAPAFGVFTTPSHLFAEDRWHQIVVRRSGNMLDLFYDTVRYRASGAGAIGDAAEGLLIGARDGSILPTQGRIDEVAIWDRAIEDSEVHALWNGGAGTSIHVPDRVSSLSLLCLAAMFMAPFGWHQARIIRGHP